MAKYKDTSSGHGTQFNTCIIHPLTFPLQVGQEAYWSSFLLYHLHHYLHPVSLTCDDSHCYHMQCFHLTYYKQNISLLKTELKS